MGNKIFVSFSGSENDAAYTLSERLKWFVEKQYRHKVYFCYSEELSGADWVRGLTQHLAEADLLISVMDQAYLNSSWCFLEYQFFMQVAQQNAARINVPDYQTFHWPIALSGRQELKNGGVDFGALLKRVKKVIVEYDEVLRPFFPNLQFSIEDLSNWHEDITRTTNTFFDFDGQNLIKNVALDEGTALEKKLKSALENPHILELLKTSKAAVTHQDSARLIQLAEIMALFAIRMDRFHSGGWGFSFGDLFDVDDDGNELPHGLYENNLVVLTALSPHVSDTTYRSEFLSAFFRPTPQELLAKLTAEDRKPISARASAYLMRSGAVAAQGHKIIDDLLSVVQQDDHFLNRWSVNFPTQRILIDDALTYDLFARITMEETSADSSLLREVFEHLLTKGYSEREAENFRDDFEKWAQKGRKAVGVRLADHFSDMDALLERVDSLKLDAIDSTEFRQFYRQRILELYAFFLVANGKDDVLETFKLNWEYEADDARFGRICEKVSAQFRDHKPDSKKIGGRLFSLATLYIVIVLRIMKTDSGDLPLSWERESREAQLWEKWRDTAEPLLYSGNVFHSDAAAWAAILLLCKELRGVMNQKSFVNETHKKLSWQAADKIRESRLDAIRGFDRSSEALGDLSSIFPAEFSRLWSTVVSELFPQNETLRKLKFGGSHYSFFGHSFDHASTSEDVIPIHELGQTIGNLYIRRREDAALEIATPTIPSRRQTFGRKDHIFHADEGYNTLFVRPLGQLLGMKIPNLQKLQKFIGSDDEELVAIISKSIIMSCYEPAKKKERKSQGEYWRVVDFEEATNDAIANIANNFDPSINRTIGVLHLLELDRADGGTAPIWCMRTISARRLPDPTEAENLEFAIRFVDVSRLAFTGALNVPANSDKSTMLVPRSEL